jgi:hypothetical protein
MNSVRELLELPIPPETPDAIRAALGRHWAASRIGDPGGENDIYHEDAICEYPQSGERVLGSHNLRALREQFPAAPTLSVRRVFGSGDLWITESEITYEGRIVHYVSIMEFRDGKVARETQYITDPFTARKWRQQFVEQKPSTPESNGSSG